MSETLNDLLGWMEALPPLVAYVMLLAIAYGENVLPPIPGDVVVIFGGYLAGAGQLNFVAVVLLATLGGALGFMTMYAIGYAVGGAVTNPNRLRWFPKDRIANATRWLDRYGYGLIAANRFLSGLRSVISLAVGMARTNPYATAAFATLSAAVWTLLLTYGGYLLGENWQIIAAHLRTYGQVVLSLVVLVACLVLVRQYLKRRGSARKAKRSGNNKNAGG